MVDPTPPTPLRRGLLWSFLVLVLITVALGFWWTDREPPPAPPPILSEIPDFTLTDQWGETVSRADLLGAPWVADLIFTRCVLACPVMTGKMAILDRRLPGGAGAEEGGNGATPPVRLVSISVDPEHDQPDVLADYAEGFNASDRWLFLTGDRSEIVRVAGEGLRLGFDPNPRLTPLEPGDNIYHSTKFVLVDAEGRVRGYYDAMEGDDPLAELERDLSTLE